VSKEGEKEGKERERNLKEQVTKKGEC